MQPLALTACSVVSAIGCGIDATLSSLRDRRGALRPCDFGGLTTGYIGRINALEAHALPQAAQVFNCRNNRLTDMALRTDGFAGRVIEARERYGANRIARRAGNQHLRCAEYGRGLFPAGLGRRGAA